MVNVRSLFAAAFVAMLSFVAPVAATAAQNTPSLNFPISTTTAQGAFTGELRITGFGVQNNQLVASGIVTGTIVGAANATSAVAKSVTIPVVTSGQTAATTSAMPAAPTASGSCGILHLELGPVDLDLLGLMLHLNRIVLDLSAAPGAGNLLGNLLCSVTNLLNTSGSLTQVANILNQIIGLLG